VVTNGQTLERVEQMTNAMRKTNAANSADISRKDISVYSDASANYQTDVTLCEYCMIHVSMRHV
jgi:hypothetical protein